MYWTQVSEIDNPFLHDAAMVCEERGFKLRSIHVDTNGECAVSYWGSPNIYEVASILQNYMPGDASYEECFKMVSEEEYYKWFPCNDREHPNGFTQIYTPDGIDYRNWKALL